MAELNYPINPYKNADRGKNPSDATIRRMQKSDLARAYRMLKHGPPPDTDLHAKTFISDAAGLSSAQARLDDAIKQIDADKASQTKSQRRPSFADLEEKAKQEKNHSLMLTERDGVYKPPQFNSSAANAERDGGPEYDTSKMKGEGMKHGGMIKKYAKGGSVSASSRGDGIAQRGKTKGRIC